VPFSRGAGSEAVEAVTSETGDSPLGPVVLGSDASRGCYSLSPVRPAFAASRALYSLGPWLMELLLVSALPP